MNLREKTIQYIFFITLISSCTAVKEFTAKHSPFTTRREVVEKGQGLPTGQAGEKLKTESDLGAGKENEGAEESEEEVRTGRAGSDEDEAIVE
ncbi:MAG: hypothetical protein EBU73_00550, partial [Chitinophagia bacterium]|nr:hypothetical protein [Chitinophagia bacterium]